MIKLKVKGPTVKCKAGGVRVELLAELSLGTAHILTKILSNAPDNDFKETMIKTFFENVLFSMKEMEGEINE